LLVLATSRWAKIALGKLYGMISNPGQVLDDPITEVNPPWLEGEIEQLLVPGVEVPATGTEVFKALKRRVMDTWYPKALASLQAVGLLLEVRGHCRRRIAMLFRALLGQHITTVCCMIVGIHTSLNSL
jgi:hypothetical protein